MRQPPSAPAATNAPPRAAGARYRIEHNPGRALLLSLALHAAIVSLQFGEPGFGSPWFGGATAERRASVPTLDAVLTAMAPAVEVEQRPAPAARSASSAAEEPRIPAATQDAAPASEPAAAAPAGGIVAALRAAPTATVVAVHENAVLPDAAPPPPIPVLTTDQDSRWSVRPAEEAPQPVEPPQEQPVTRDDGAEPEALARSMIESADQEAQRTAQVLATEEQELRQLADQARLESERKLAEEAAAAREVLDQQRLADQARLESERKLAEEAAAAREVLEQQRLADQARLERERQLAEQAAAALASEALARQQRLAEQTRLERERKAAEEAAAAYAREALERQRIADQARLDDDRRLAERAAAVASAKPDDATTGSPSGSPAAGPGTPKLTGLDLARRALDQARRGGLLPPAAAPPDPAPRRGSILGRPPRDISLAFYGEAWREKVERIGSMNYPPLSRRRLYDPLVVTVSINSDGTLADVRILQSSGDKSLDEAVRRIVVMSAPFAAFPPDLRRNYDVVDITRTWTFLDERPRMNTQ